MRSSTLKIHMKRHTEEEDFDGNLSKAIEHMIEEEGDEEESSSDSEVESPEDEEVAYSSIDDQISYDSEKSPAKSEMIRVSALRFRLKLSGCDCLFFHSNSILTENSLSSSSLLSFPQLP